MQCSRGTSRLTLNGPCSGVYGVYQLPVYNPKPEIRGVHCKYTPNAKSHCKVHLVLQRTVRPGTLTNHRSTQPL